MSSPAATYDLMLLLDPEAEEARRAKLVSDASAAITKQGELLRHDTWGERQLAYHIERKAAAEYHLMQFHVSSPELLGALDRSLRIADEVLRFRLIKLKPGVPEAPDAQTAGPATPRRATNGAERARPAHAGARPGEPADSAARAPTAEPTPEPAPAPAVSAGDGDGEDRGESDAGADS